MRLFLLTWLIIIVLLPWPRCVCRPRSPRCSRSSAWPCSCCCSPWRRPPRGRTFLEPAQGRRLRCAGLRRGRGLPVLQRGLGGHWRQGALARPSAAEVKPFLAERSGVPELSLQRRRPGIVSVSEKNMAARPVTLPACSYDICSQGTAIRLTCLSFTPLRK